MPFLYCLFELSEFRLHHDHAFSDFFNLFNQVNDNFDSMIATNKLQYTENSLKYSSMTLYGYNKGLGELVSFNKFIMDKLFVTK